MSPGPVGCGGLTRPRLTFLPSAAWGSAFALPLAVAGTVGPAQQECQTFPHTTRPRERSQRVNNIRHRQHGGTYPAFSSRKTQQRSRSPSQPTLMVPQGIAEALQAYTGLTPAAAATILALMLATYLVVSSLFVTPAAPTPAAPPKQQREEEKDKEKEEKEEDEAMPFVYPDPVEVGEVTLEQLRAYDGKDPAKQILIAIRGQVYDVSRGRLFYGPQGPYSLFAGRDATRALALMSFDPNDLTGDLDGLSPDDLEVLQDWEEKFKERYPRVGHLARQDAADSGRNAAQPDHEEGDA